MNHLDFSHLKGRVCVLTGAGVIGRSISEALVLAGVKTAILNRTLESGEQVVKAVTKNCSTECIAVQANVLDKASLVKAKKIINQKLGSIDFLINGAGGNSPEATTEIEQISDAKSIGKSFFGLDLEGFDKVFALNFTGTILPTLIFAEDMLKKRKGAIVNISSMNSFRPLTKIPAYSAAKASVNNFTQWLAVHMAKTGVRVNAIAPGFFLTHQNKFLLVDEKTGKPTSRGNKIINNTPVGRYGEPGDLQGATLFLLSDMSEFITGVILPVDGGYSAFGGV